MVTEYPLYVIFLLSIQIPACLREAMAKQGLRRNDALNRDRTSFPRTCLSDRGGNLNRYLWL